MPKDPFGAAAGVDSGVRQPLTMCNGMHPDRPDTSMLLDEARRLVRHARRCCTRGSRRDRRLRARARRLRQRSDAVQVNAARHLARDLSESNDVVVLENLAIPNMTASGRGTQTRPGRRTRCGLNRRLATARLGQWS